MLQHDLPEGSSIPAATHLPAVTSTNTSIIAVLQNAISQGVSVDILERLLAMQERIMAQQAQEAYNTAMAALQAELPIIKKTRSVPTQNGAVAYRYAPLDSIIAQVQPLTTKHGFSYTFDMQLDNEMVTMHCIVTHTAGHSKVSSYTSPWPEKTRLMTPAQVNASAVTFAKRYCFCNAFGIMTGDDDHDGRQQQQLATEEQAITLYSLIDGTGYTEASVLKNQGVQRFSQLTTNKAQQLIQWLQQKLNKQQEDDIPF